MSSNVRYEPDHVGTGRGLLEPEMDALVKSFADEGLRFAQAISPVETGAYQASFRAEVTTEEIAGDRRSTAHIVNDSPYAGWVEASHHVLRRTADHLGSM